MAKHYGSKRQAERQKARDLRAARIYKESLASMSMMVECKHEREQREMSWHDWHDAAEHVASMMPDDSIYSLDCDDSTPSLSEIFARLSNI